MKRAIIIWIIALCLAVCISITCINAEPSEIHAATGSFSVNTPTPSPTVPPVTPTPSPTPTESPVPTPSATPTTPATPTATATPVVTPETPTPSPTPDTTPVTTPTPTSSTAGSSQPSISHKLTIDVLGQKSSWLRTEDGKTLQEIVATSANSEVTVTIPKDTFALDANGEPLTEITIIITDQHTKAPSLTKPDDYYVIYIYELTPDGSSFSKPIEIEMTYDPLELPKSPEQLLFKTYSLYNMPNEWMEIPCISDLGENTVKISTIHLSAYVLIAAPMESPMPVSDEVLISHTQNDNTWIFLILILPAASLMFFIYVLFRWRHTNN